MFLVLRECTAVLWTKRKNLQFLKKMGFGVEKMPGRLTDKIDKISYLWKLEFVVLRKCTAVRQTNWINRPNRYSACFSSVSVITVVVGDKLGSHDRALDVWGVKKMHGNSTDKMTKILFLKKMVRERTANWQTRLTKPPALEKWGLWCWENARQFDKRAG